MQQALKQWQSYQASFSVALAIAPSFLYFVIALHGFLGVGFGLKKMTGITLTVFYLLCATVSYGAQLTMVPFYLRHQMPAMAEIWFFFNVNSISYFINQTGYALWGLAVILLFGSLVKQRGMVQWIGILFVASSLLSLVAYAGLLLEIPFANALTLASGILVFPIAVLACLVSIKNRKARSESDQPSEENPLEES